MIDIIADPKVVTAAVAAVVAIIGAAAATVVAVLRYVGRAFDVRLAHISATASEARDAAQSADREIRNNHDTNVRDDLDRAIETVWVVSDQIGALAAQVKDLSDQSRRMVETLDAHGRSLAEVQARVGRISDELHDERTSREAAQRTIDEHAHDAHARLHDRLDKLQEKVEKVEKWERQ